MNFLTIFFLLIISLVFSLIYFDFNPLNWWLVTSIWGRIILLILEYGVIMSSFNNKKNEKN